MSPSFQVSRIEELRAAVRVGDFTCQELLDECWIARDHTEDIRTRLRIRTLAWEIYDSRGEFEIAMQRLRDGRLVEDAMDLVYQATANASDFVITTFPQGMPADERRNRYKLWRQRVMGMIAYGFAEYRLNIPNHIQRFEIAQRFIEMCLEQANYPCNGTHARLHFFLAQTAHADFRMREAAKLYDRALFYCFARADEQMDADLSTAQKDTERAFAIYCLGKLQLKLGQLDYEQGRLASARQHTREARLLLRVSRDPFLPHMAELLDCQIEREEPGFLRNGGDLAKRINKARDALKEHTLFYLEASLEAIKTCVYLRHHGGGDDTCLTLRNADREVDSVIRSASRSKLRIIHYRAWLVKARTLNRLADFDGAFKALEKAGRLGDLHLPPVLEAEAWFVRGKIHATRAANQNANRTKDDRDALDCFTNALEFGHASLTFDISCQLHRVEALRRLGDILGAEPLLEDVRRRLSAVENTFLQARFEALSAEIHRDRICVFQFEKGFNVESAKNELEKKYIDAVSRRVKLSPRALLAHWSTTVSEEGPPISREKFKGIVNRQFPGVDGE